MKHHFILPFLVLLASSCVNDPYQNLPEGSVSETAPAGYDSMVYGGITYWSHYNHYYRYWPNYGWVVVRPPYGRPPDTKPPKPVHPIERPPAGKPPGVQPVPATRPSTPSYRPAVMPSYRPAVMPSYRPSVRPSMPAPRPSLR